MSGRGGGDTIAPFHAGRAMPFMIDDDGLCSAVLEAAKGMGPRDIGDDVVKVMAETIFGMEDRFVTDLVASPVLFEIERKQTNSKNFVVRRGLVYIHVKSKPNVAIIVPPHFVTDHASVPYVARWIVNQTGRHSAASVLHDWLYTVAEPPADQTQFRKERFRADRIFLEAMRTSGVGLVRRSLLYRAARLAGAHGFGAPSELRFIDPKSPDRLIDPALFDKSVLRRLTIIPRPVKPRASLLVKLPLMPSLAGRKPRSA